MCQTMRIRQRHSWSSMLSLPWPMSNGAGGHQLSPDGTQQLPRPGSKICGEGTMTMTTSLSLYGSLPFERRGTWDATIAASPPPPIPPVTIDINAHAVQGSTTMMTTTAKSPSNPASYPNHAAAFRQCVLRELCQPFPGPASCKQDRSLVVCLQQAPNRAAVPADVGQRMARTIGGDGQPSLSSSSSTPPPKNAIIFIPFLPRPHRRPSSSSTSN